MIAHRQVNFWHNSETLFQHAAAVTDENYTALGGLGIVELRRKNPEAALRYFRSALDAAEPHGAAPGIKYYIGVAYQMLGKPQEALTWLSESKPLPEQAPDRNYRIGLSLAEQGKLDEAEKSFNEALAGRPEDAEFQTGLAAIYQRRGETNRAEQLLESAVAKDPSVFAAQRGLADLLLATGDATNAVQHYAAAIQLQPSDSRLLQGYAEALLATGKRAEAIPQLEKAVQLAPTNSFVKLKLAELYGDTGQTARSIAVYKEAVAADPKLVGALNDLAWILATDPDPKNRDGNQAVEFARRACEQTDWKVPLFIGTLAAAYADAGNFKEAVLKAEKARELAQEAHQDQIAQRNAELLELYRAGKAYHEAGGGK